MIKVKPAELSKLMKQMGGSSQKKKSKYNATKTKVDDITFDSKAEAIRYELNKLRIQSEELSYQLLQVPFRLPGGTKYVCDFLEVHPCGRVEYVDVKGKVTATFKKNKKQVEALYPVEIVCVKLLDYKRMTFERFEV